jgi:predicted amidohydrolase YtcJ
MTTDADRIAAAARWREADMKLMHIAVEDEAIVMCGSDRELGMKLGTRQEVWDAGDDGCWACIDGYDEACHMGAYFRARGML